MYLIVLPSFTEKANSVFSALPGKSTNSECKSLLSPGFLFASFDFYVHPYARSHQLKMFCLLHPDVMLQTKTTYCLWILKMESNSLEPQLSL